MTATAWNQPTPLRGLPWLRPVPEQPAPAKVSEAFDPARAGRGAGYGQATLEAECERVMYAAEGQRNATLNIAAFSLMQLVAGGELEEPHVARELTAAAKLSGLGDTEIRNTIASGFRAGRALPRTAPKQNGYDLRGTVTGTVTPPAGEETIVTAPLRRGDFTDLSKRERAQPQYLQRQDGVALLYPGKDSYLYAETESGKSWIVALTIVQCVTSGVPIMVVDFEEGDELELGTRLLTLGLTENQLNDSSLFRYLMVDARCAEEIMAEADDMGAQVVINEGMSVAYDVFGLQIKDNDSATAFRRWLVKPHLIKGRAVLTTDHVVKDRDSRGRYAIGGVMKLNAASGGAFLLVNVEGLSPGKRGASSLYVTKDRPGGVKRHGVHAGDKFDPQVKRVGTLIVDDSRTRVSYLDVAIIPPSTESFAAVETSSLEDKILAAVDRIAKAGRDVNIRMIRAEQLGKHSLVEEEIERLITRGVLSESRGAHAARIFARVEPPP